MRKGLLIFIVLASISTFGGCRAKPTVADVADQSTPTNRPMRIVTDDLGRQVAVPVKIARVVSLAPNLTENIFAVGAGARLVGVTTFCNYPEQAKEIPKIGDTMTPNMESIIALKPDVVFVSTASQIEAFMKTLEANGIAVYVTNPTSLDGVMKNLKELGELMGTHEQANQLVADLTARINAVYQRVSGEKKIHVFVQISKEPLFTIGKQSFLTALLEQAGGESVTANVDSAYPKLSKETASALNPETLILSDSEDNKEPNEVFKNSSAVKNGHVILLNADQLSRPGPRLVNVLEYVARQLHMGKFEWKRGLDPSGNSAF
ncbi:MAG: cobalamin-binding protein [Pyrinomonadaceae bacterium]